ncbi:hypothetical protein KP509_12G003800 [Ceratopteris richardii]|uniref:Retinoblastoma-related protein n=3 Tax=Ceratopteris richardii TaxID=49495 RepID=A0A8T2TKQ3_CERRI|nr:hypothetical protein KP509_12G003800 [Ceratopteris richardii]
MEIPGTNALSDLTSVESRPSSACPSTELCLAESQTMLSRAEALLRDCFQVHFQELDDTRCAAFRLFKETEHHMESCRGAFGSLNEANFVKCWIASIIYYAFRLTRKRGGGDFTLTKLLFSLDIQVLDFFKEAAAFLQKADSVLRTLHEDAYIEFQKHIRKMQAIFVHLTALYDNYEKNFFKFFAPNETPLPVVSNSLDCCSEKYLYLRFGWMLFLSLRIHCSEQFEDLMTCANGLIAVFVILIIHLPRGIRKVSLNDRAIYAVCSNAGVSIVSSLCHLYDASEEDVRNMLNTVNAMIQSLIEGRRMPIVLDNDSEQTKGMDTEGLRCYQALLKPEDIIFSTHALDREYIGVYQMEGGLDERCFLPEMGFSTAPTCQLSFSLRGVKRKYEDLCSPSKPLDSRAQTLAECISTPPPKVKSTGHKMPPPTPVSVSMSTSKWLRSVIAPLPAEPSPLLLSYLKSCNGNMAKEVIERAHMLLDLVFSFESCKGSLSEYANSISILSGGWTSQRRLEALKLYFKVLGAMCEAEVQRLNTENLSPLLSNDRFHRCLLACSVEVVVASYSTVSIAFPAVLDRMGITAFDLNKVIESFVRHEETLPRELKRHLNTVEERLLESLAWSKGSSMYNSLMISRPHLKSEICQQGLLADPMPSLECLKSQYECSFQQYSLESTARHALEDFQGMLLPSTSVASSSKREDATVTPLILSPIKERSSFVAVTPTKLMTQRPLHSAFASPQKHSSGAGDSSVETAISIFFQKVLKLAAIRIKLICGVLKQPSHLMEDIYKLFQHLLHEETHLFFNRHIDQIILCSLFGVCKVEKIKLTFKEIVQGYRQLSHHKPHVFRAVPLAPREGRPMAGDIIQFYNDIFIPSAKAYLIELSTQTISTNVNDDSEKVEVSSPFRRSLFDASPRKVSASHNIYVSPLKTSRVLSPHSRRLYACIGESTHAYQSPSKDLTDINRRLNGRRPGRLDFSDVELISDAFISGNNSSNKDDKRT